MMSEQTKAALRDLESERDAHIERVLAQAKAAIERGDLATHSSALRELSTCAVDWRRRYREAVLGKESL